MPDERASFEDFEYLSWISNITGILQFQLNDITGYRHDRFVGDAIYRYYYDPITKDYSLFCSLLTDLRDKREKRSSIYTRIFLFLDGNESDCLCGNIYLLDYIPPKIIESAGLYQAIKSDYRYLKSDKKLSKLLKAFNSSLSSKRNLSSLEFRLNNFLDENGSNYIIKKISIKLNRNGIILLKASKDSPKAVEIANIKSAYFFIKFLFHKDKFHDKSAENIVPIVNLKNSNASNAFESIYDSMLRYVTEIRKNNPSPYMLNSMLGVIEYIKTFILIARDSGSFTKEDYESKSEYLENLSNSIKSSLSKKPFRPITFYQFLEDFRLFSFIVVLITGLYKLFGQDKQFKDALVESIFLHLRSISSDYQLITIIGAIIVFTLATQGLIQTIYNGNRKANSFFMIFYRPYYGVILFFKLRSLPNIINDNDSKTKRFLFGSFVPFLINIEMFLRRSEGSKKARIIFFIGILFLIISIISIYLLTKSAR